MADCQSANEAARHERREGRRVCCHLAVESDGGDNQHEGQLGRVAGRLDNGPAVGC